jgi:hypothetical protein
MERADGAWLWSKRLVDSQLAKENEQEINGTKGSQIWDRLKFALVQQAIIFVLAGMILDGGGIALVCFFGGVAYWVIVVMMFLRRLRGLSNFDMAFLTCGPLLLSVVSFFLSRIVWGLRGYMFP